MNLDERDLALTLEKRTRQLWAEKHLEMAPSPEEEAWTKWYNFLHDKVEAGLKLMWPGAVDMTPSGPEEPFTEAYQGRLRVALHGSHPIVGAHYACQNACVRVPLTERKSGTTDLEQIYLLGLHPTGAHLSDRTIKDFMYLKTACAEAQMEPSFHILPPKLLSPTLCATPSLAVSLPDSKTFEFRFATIAETVYKANRDLSDPLTPPGGGLFFLPLDAGIVPREELPRYLIANQGLILPFEDLEQEVKDCRTKEFTSIENRCLIQGAEAVIQVDPLHARPIRGDMILACSVAAIPLVRCQSEEDGVPLAAVFSWKDKGKLCSKSFHLGDLLSHHDRIHSLAGSDRLRRFQNFVREGKFCDSYVIASDQVSQDFIGRFVPGLEDRCYGAETAAPSTYYCNPAFTRRSLEGKAALLGLTAPPSGPEPKPAAVLELAATLQADPSSVKTKTNPVLKAIYSGLAWKNQTLLDLADKVTSRCEAAQSFAQVECYNERFENRTRPWLLYPAGDLDRRLALAPVSPQAKELVVKTSSDNPRANAGEDLVRGLLKSKRLTKYVPLNTFKNL